MVEVPSRLSTDLAHCGSTPPSSPGPLAGLLPAAYCGRLLSVFGCQVWVLVDKPVQHIRDAVSAWPSSAEGREAGEVRVVRIPAYVHIAAESGFLNAG